MSAYTYIYLFSSRTSLKELCLQLHRLFCIKMPQRLQQPFQRLSDTIPHSAMSLGISENNNYNKRGDVNAFFWDQTSLEWLYKLLYYLECSCKSCLTFFSLSSKIILLVVLSLPVALKLGHYKYFGTYTCKKINNENRKFEEEVIKLKPNQQRPKFSKASAPVLDSLTLFM